MSLKRKRTSNSNGGGTTDTGTTTAKLLLSSSSAHNPTRIVSTNRIIRHGLLLWSYATLGLCLSPLLQGHSVQAMGEEEMQEVVVVVPSIVHHHDHHHYHHPTADDDTRMEFSDADKKPVSLDKRPTTVSEDGANPTGTTTTTTAAAQPSSNAEISRTNRIRVLQQPDEETCGGLVCQYNSTCQQGDTTFYVENDAGIPTMTNQNGYYCVCPDGFAGLDCGRPYQTCQDIEKIKDGPRKCYHGGMCLSDEQIPDLPGAGICDCTQAYYLDQLYTGRYCDIIVTQAEYCPEHPTGLFCVNGGSCPLQQEGDQSPHCTCPNGYFGSHCEYAIPPSSPLPPDDETKAKSCPLECKNEGTCQIGRANAVWGNKDDYFCACTQGYGGIQCEHLAETCDDGSVCLHGARCESDGGGSFYCACPDPYLGGSGCVEKQKMELCMPTLGPEYSQSMAVPAFCLNGGTCRDVLVENNLLKFACDCPPLFEGPHCEFLRTAEAIGDIDDLINPPGSGGRAAFFGGFLALGAMGFVAAFFAFRQVRRIRKSRRREEDIVLNLQNTREENFGAISANGSMLFPGMAPPPSTFSDPTEPSFTSGELLHDIDLT